MSDLARRSCLRPVVVRVCVALVTAALLAACSTEAGATGARAGRATSASGSPRPVADRDTSTAARDLPGAAVLRAWDDARARAFADGDPAALRRLYVTGSRAGRADVALLRAYLSRGLRVEGLRMQVLVLEVLHQDRRHLRLRVTDRVSGGVVVGGGSQVALPRDQASTRVVELRRSDDGRWRVVTVSESGRRPAAR